MSTTRLHRDERALASLEFALVVPCLLLFVFGMFSLYSLSNARRAMDFGVERALRYAAINSATPTSGVVNAYCTAASIISGDVGSTTNCSADNVTVTSATGSTGTVISISATYTWAPPDGYANGTAPQFASTTLTATGKVRSLH